jgi:hypothetical protein
LKRRWALTAAGVAAALLANYWVLEGPLAERSDASGAWISDLGARSEADAKLFNLLDGAAGVAVVVLALLLWPVLAGRSQALRLGVWALGLVGVCGIVDALFPLSCAETLQPGCELGYDAVDVVHAVENVVAVLVTGAAFLLLGLGLRGVRETRGLGTATLALGGCWLVLTAVMGSGLVIAEMDELKGLFQRLGQVVLGAWFVTLAVGVGARGAGEGGGRLHTYGGLRRGTAS